MSNPNDLIMLLFSTCRFLKESLRKKVPIASSIVQFETLRYIVLHKNTSMRQLAEYLSISPPATTLIVETLVEQHLVERKIVAKDRRLVRLVLTKKGEQFVERAKNIASKTLSKAVVGLTTVEKKQLEVILKKILKTK
jgi:DNA-binding MarR family transcriptional regulator